MCCTSRISSRCASIAINLFCGIDQCFPISALFSFQGLVAPQSSCLAFPKGPTSFSTRHILTPRSSFFNVSIAHGFRFTGKFILSFSLVFYWAVAFTISPWRLFSILRLKQSIFQIIEALSTFLELSSIDYKRCLKTEMVTLADCSWQKGIFASLVFEFLLSHYLRCPLGAVGTRVNISLFQLSLCNIPEDLQPFEVVIKSPEGRFTYYNLHFLPNYKRQQKRGLALYETANSVHCNV